MKIILEKLSTTKTIEHIPSDFSMSTISSFKSIENKHDIYRGKHCMKKFCESLREHAMKIINSKKKKVKLLTEEQQESYDNAKICHICKGKFEYKYVKDKKNIVKLKIIVSIRRNIKVLRIAYII